MTDDSPGSAYTAIAKADLAADVVSTAIDWLLDK
jgi:hypothetical protein